MEYKDYYKSMGVARDASQDEIKRVYRQLARQYHPDVSHATDAEVRFMAPGESYAVLKDVEKRAAYDRLGQHGKGGQDFRPPSDSSAGFEFSGASSDGHSGPGADQFSDFFESLYGRGFNAGNQQRAPLPCSTRKATLRGVSSCARSSSR
jgi:curved DNA-binding protein